MSAVNSIERQGLLARLLDEDLDTAEQIICLKQLALEYVDADILAYAVKLFRGRMNRVTAEGSGLVDLCGTGGDKSGSFNISTTAALVVAGAGYRVAKHGNVSITSKSGSIDLLRAMGVPIPETPDAALSQLERAGIMFLFAPYYHPAFKKFAVARKELAGSGTRTIFNLLGPLLNPASVRRSIIGVFSPDFVRPVAEVLLCTGTERALVFHGNGMDELSLTGPNVVCEISDGRIVSHTWVPDYFGLPGCITQDLAGGTPEENAETAQGILEGKVDGARRNMVILNAGAAIYAAGNDMTLNDAIGLARRSLESGDAARVLERLFS